MNRQYVSLGIIALSVIALYGGFLYSPIVFDDIYFFLPGTPEKFLDNFYPYPRQWVYATLALTWEWFGPGLLAFRVESLFLHLAASISVFFFVRQVQVSMAEAPSNHSVLLPLLAALIFAMHPAAVYGAAYLIERTIVTATLFALMSWTFLLMGLQTNRHALLWWSVAMYACSVLSKEHAVMVPVVGAALGMWWWRTQSSRTSGLQLLLRLRWIMGISATIAFLIVLFARGALGHPYELEAEQMLREVQPESAWLLSVLTQGFLFFKYLGLWLVPNPLWMSVDMREPFAQSFLIWPQTFGSACFGLWPLIAVWLLWKGGRVGLVGFAMIAPWLLFATELTTVRIQEIFVLYRSYLWVAPSLAIVLLLNSVLSSRLQVALIIVIPLLLAPLALNRLSSFSHPLLLWDDAARLVEGTAGVAGLDRIYRNRGIAFFKVGKYELAIADYSRAIEAKPNFYHAYNDRASALFALKRFAEALVDFETALQLKPDYPNSTMGRATALEALGRMDEAKVGYGRACDVGWRPACEKIRNQGGDLLIPR